MHLNQRLDALPKHFYTKLLGDCKEFDCEICSCPTAQHLLGWHIKQFLYMLSCNMHWATHTTHRNTEVLSLPYLAQGWVIFLQNTTRAPVMHVYAASATNHCALRQLIIVYINNWRLHVFYRFPTCLCNRDVSLLFADRFIGMSFFLSRQ